jgi:hypothetical protein
VYPFIIDFVTLSERGIVTSVWEYLNFIVDVKKYNTTAEDYTDINTEFFNRLIAYNSRQCSGELTVKVKDAVLDQNYLLNQIKGDTPHIITVDRNERNWNINELRDHRIDYNVPMFITKSSNLQNNYYIDKVLNSSSIDFNKNWMEKESFRDKYLELRLFFDNFAEDDLGVISAKDLKVLIHFVVDLGKRSYR